MPSEPRPADDDGDARRSVDRVTAAMKAIPRFLAEALGARLPSAPPVGGSVVTTGIGGSEGPARLLAYHLERAGRASRFAPLSEFALSPPSADLLVVFSQGLSPNACLALEDARVARTVWLVTSVGHDATSDERARRLARFVAMGVVPIVAPPGDERGMLVRWIGPTVAQLLALRLAGHLGAATCREDALADAPERYRECAAEPWPAGAHLVLAGVHADEAHAQRWKVLETLLAGDPPVWDVLQAAHGPLQSLAAGRHPVVTLERPMAHRLVARLIQSLPPDLPVTRLTASNDDVLAILEHTAMVDASLLAALRRRPRNLFDWPGRGRDEPLYGLGREASGSDPTTP